MKYFLEMIEHVKRDGLKWFDGSEQNDWKTIDKSVFFKQVEKCQPLVFLTSGETVDLDLINENGIIKHVKFDAPFPVFSIEMLGTELTVPKPSDEVNITTHCILAYEFEPQKFHYFAYVTFKHSNCQETKMVISTNIYDAIVEKMISRLNTQRAGVEYIRQKVKIGTGKEKKFHTIRKIIHIRPKSEVIDPSDPQHRNIDWSHRWLVRGHWRKISGLGKDREGQYCIKDFTWVKEHEKGPEDAPLISKVRIVT